MTGPPATESTWRNGVRGIEAVAWNGTMISCSRCESFPADPSPTGTLFLSLPLAHTKANVRKSLMSRGIPFDEPIPLIMAISLEGGRLDDVVSAMDDCLGEFERRDTRALILREGEQPTLSDIMSTRSLTSLMAGVQGRWLVEMLRANRLTTHFQPIVRADDPGTVYAYECLLRGTMKDGTMVFPDRIYGAAREAELLFQLDRAARLTAIREAVTYGIRQHLFINFNPSSIYDPKNCLRSTIGAIQEANIDPSRIVFEIVESDRVDIDLMGIMDTYRKAGFGVALDDLGAGYGSLNLLNSLRPDIVKLDMKLVRDVDRDPYKAGIASKLLEMARKLKIETVAEGIETAGELEWFREHGADYFQGYYIARPASPPPQPSPSPRLRGPHSPIREQTCPITLSPPILESSSGLSSKILD